MVKLVLPSAVIPKSPADLPPPGPSGEKPTEISVKPDRKKLRRLVVLGFSVLIFVLVVIIIWYLQLHGYIGVKSKETSFNSSSQASLSAQGSKTDFSSLINTAATFSSSAKLTSGRAVFVRDGDIWEIDSNGQKKLTNATTQVHYTNPLLTGDNSKIVYLAVNVVKSGPTPYQVIVVNYDGTGVKTVASYNDNSSPIGIDLSGDSHSVLLARNESGKGVLKLLDLTTNKEIRSTAPADLPTDACGYTSPSISGSLRFQLLSTENKTYWLDGNHYLFTKTSCNGQYDVETDSAGNVYLNTVSQALPVLDYTQFVATGTTTTDKSLYYFGSDGKLIKQISIPQAADSAIISVDKKYIFYTSSQEQDSTTEGGTRNVSSLWRIGTDGTGNTKIFDDDAYFLKLRQFSGDGNTLIYERVGNDLDLFKKIAAGDTTTSDLAAVAPRTDIYAWDSTSGNKIKLVENGYQATYSSK